MCIWKKNSSNKGFVFQLLFRLLGITGLDITVLKTIGPDFGQEENAKIN